MSERPLTALVAALSEEAEALLHRLAQAGASPPLTRVAGGASSRGQWPVSVGWLSGASVAVAVTGDGERNARLGVRALLDRLAPDRLVAVGTAGGLVPGVKLGDLIVASRVVREGTATLRPRHAVLELALRATGGLEGVVVTAESLADTPVAKAELYRTSCRNARRELPAVVDLESSFYAAAAEDAGIPWVVIRAVSDTSSESLPSYLNLCRDTGGSIRRSAVLCRALRSPGTLPTLFRLRHRTLRGGERLADAVEKLMAAWDSSADLASRTAS